MKIKLKTMACPINEGKHTLHDYRYVVTDDAEVEFSYQMPKDWRLSQGSIICEMTDCHNQKELATLLAKAPEAENQLKALKSIISKAKVYCEIYRGISEIDTIYSILDT